VTKLDAKGSRLLFSTFLGGEGFDAGFISFFDRAGNVHVEGDTGSTDFPVTPRAFQATYGGGPNDAWVAKLNRTGTALVYSTYLGGSDFDIAGTIRVDHNGVGHVAGVTGSTDFPVTSGAFQPGFAGGPADAFLVLLNRDGARLRFGSYLGGGGDDGSVGRLLAGRQGQLLHPRIHRLDQLPGDAGRLPGRQHRQV
jgi:hypothetical protein